MGSDFKILRVQYFDEYCNRVSANRLTKLTRLELKEKKTPEDFEYYVQASAAYSSNLEGNSIDIDTYLKNKKFNVKSKPKEMAEIDDLIAPYNFAINTPLTQK